MGLLGEYKSRRITVPSRSSGLDYEEFKENFKIDVKRCTDTVLEFDMIGINASIANAIRRIILSDIETIAIEKVHIYNNTSLIPDEIVAHRLGLIPLKIDDCFYDLDLKPEDPKAPNIVFELNVTCSTDSDGTMINNFVTSGMLNYLPCNDFEDFGVDNPAPLQDDIVIAKLVPGQAIHMKMYCKKSNGRDHAKFSPVSSVFYRLMPTIVLEEPIYGDLAVRLQSYFSKGVISLKKSKKQGHKAIVVDPRIDSNSRNVKYDEELKDKVTLGKINDHFIFTIETIGDMTPKMLFLKALDILRKKSSFYKTELENLNAGNV